MTNEQYIELISTEPLEEMIKQGQGYRYIPKSVLQKELLQIFNGETKWEMLRDTVSKNGLWGTGLLHYKHPVSGEWLYVSGVASLKHMKLMQLNYPNLEAHCFINACKKIGPWFGQNLNIGSEDLPIEEMEQETPPDKETERAISMLADCATVDDVESLKLMLSKKFPEQYATRLMELQNQTNHQNSINNVQIEL